MRTKSNILVENIRNNKNLENLENLENNKNKEYLEINKNSKNIEKNKNDYIIENEKKIEIEKNKKKNINEEDIIEKLNENVYVNENVNVNEIYEKINEPNNNVQNKSICIIWSDYNINNIENKKYIKMLKDEINILSENCKNLNFKIIFTKNKELLIERKNIYIIICSGSYKEDILKNYHSLENVVNFIIFCGNIHNHLGVKDNYEKVYSVHTNFKFILNSIENIINPYSEKNEGIRVVIDDENINNLEKKNFTVIWSDKLVNSNENKNFVLNLTKKLEEIEQKKNYNVSSYFTDNTDIKIENNSKYIIICSGSYKQALLENYHDLENVIFFIIFCGNVNFHKNAQENYKKIKAVESIFQRALNEIEDIFEKYN